MKCSLVTAAVVVGPAVVVDAAVVVVVGSTVVVVATHGDASQQHFQPTIGMFSCCISEPLGQVPLASKMLLESFRK